MRIKIRRAGALEADILTRIAKASSRCRDCVVHNGGTEDSLIISPQFIFWNDVFAAEVNDEVVGFHALCVKEKKFQLAYLCVEPEFAGFGIEQKLLDHAIEHSIKSNAGLFKIISL